MMVYASDDVKAAARIEDIIHEDEPLTEREHGRYRRGKTHDSLIVDVRRQCYWWNSRDERGDVYTWLKLQRGMEFGEAVKYLAVRYGLELPVLSERERLALKARQLRETVFDVVVQFLHQELLKSPEALDYVRSRGWSVEPSAARELTVNLALLGYWSGNVKRLSEFLIEHGIDPEYPAAVALMGYRGDVAAWAKKWEVTPRWTGCAMARSEACRAKC